MIEIDFFGVGQGELLFPPNVWGPRIYAPHDIEPDKDNEDLWNALRPLAVPSKVRQGEATRVLQDAVAIAGFRLIDHEEYTFNPQATPLENSTNFLSHLLSTRPTLKKGSKKPAVQAQSSNSMPPVTSKEVVEVNLLGNIHRFALAFHDVIIALVVLNIYSQMPEGNDPASVTARAKPTQAISRLKSQSFAWGPLLGFLGCGVRGVMLATRDNRKLPCPVVLGALQVCDHLKNTEEMRITEDIWVRTHSYFMELVVKAYGVTQGETYEGVLVDKIQLATCLAYDVGYYWSVKVPNLPVTPMPKHYDGGILIRGTKLDFEEEDNE